MPINTKLLNNIKKYPHLLGQYLGYKKLLPIHSKWILSSFKYNKNIYVLQAHRNSYKTTAICVVGVIWYLFFNPDKTILICRKTDTGSSEIIQQTCRDLRSESIKTLYKIAADIDFDLVEYNNQKINLPNRIGNSKEWNYECIGIGGNITGSHYDIIICDDIITERDRYSKAEREKTKRFIYELQNIKKTNGILIFTGTPWHKDDGFGILPEADKYPIGKTGILDINSVELQDIKRTTLSSLFAANYLLKHISDENKIIPEPKYKKWDETVDCIGHIDPAYYGKNTTAFTLMQKIGNEITIKGYVWRADITTLYDKISVIAKNNKCGTIYIETNADKGLSIKGMQPYYPILQGYHESQNKHYKIISFLKANYENIYFDIDIQSDYISQIVEYEEGQDPDDAPDSIASLIRQSNIFIKSSDYNAGVIFDNNYKY